MNWASVIAVFASSDAPGNESQVCTCCLFIVFLLWLFVCDLSCPIRECFTQILRSRAVNDPFTLRSWPLSSDGLFLWYMYSTFCDRTSVYKVKFIRPETFTPHSEQLEKQLLQVMICYNTMQNLGLCSVLMALRSLYYVTSAVTRDLGV